MGKKRKLGRTGLEVDELTLGTWGLFSESYGRVFPEQQTATLQRAIDQGITSFDMAPEWGDDGDAEKAVATAVGARRDEMTYITRVGKVRGEHGLTSAYSNDLIRAQVESSLTRLATDRIDILLMQHPSIDDTLRDESVRETLDALKTEGKVRAWGAAVSHADDARAALITGSQVLSVPFSMLTPDIVWDVQSECREAGVGLLGRSPLLHGLLSGRWGERKRFGADDHRAQRWSNESLAARVRMAEEFKQRTAPGVANMAALALQFVLAHDDVASAVFGPRTPAQVVSAVESLATDMMLSPVDLQFIYNSLR
ncbi:MAG TPA: aldo/keto reductase [Polyangiales bacterium]|nr:aldo/keto reductase [Polyangiales bacterium]